MAGKATAAAGPPAVCHRAFPLPSRTPTTTRGLANQGDSHRPKFTGPVARTAMTTGSPGLGGRRELFGAVTATHGKAFACAQVETAAAAVLKSSSPLPTCTAWASTANQPAEGGWVGRARAAAGAAWLTRLCVTACDDGR